MVQYIKILYKLGRFAPCAKRPNNFIFYFSNGGRPSGRGGL